ncbi:MAG: tetratricopeptide repeat protein [Spirochaetes bacterium]|nr:tetratricopeptide repeat protein [Spirochaetota bacterium]
MLQQSKTNHACILLILTIFVSIGGNVFGDTSFNSTIAHDFLKLETELGANEHHLALLNSFLDRSKANVKHLPKYTTEQEAIETLRSIHSFIQNEGFTYKPNFLLFHGISTKQIDCDNLSALYMAIAETLRIPLIPVYAPNHSFLRIVFSDGSYLNWEPLEGKIFTNEWYIKKFFISKDAIQNGVYLKSLSRKEFIGVQYNNIGSYLFSQKKYSDAIAHFSMAISLYPQFSSAYHNRGCAYYATKRRELAFFDLLKACALDPNNAATHNTLADMYFDKKDFQNASRHYRAAIELDPENYVAYHNLGLLMKEIGKEEIAHKLLAKASELKQKTLRK